MRSILAGDVAAAALDAEILIDLRLGDVVEVEELPVGDIRHGHAAKVLDGFEALLVHVVGQAVDHLLDDLEAVGHGGRAHLHGAAAERDELRRVAPRAHAANT